MSGYLDDNTFGGWSERDDRMLQDALEHDLADAKHDASLDRRDRNMPMEHRALVSVLDLDQLPIPVVSTGLCQLCRADCALPESAWCAACATDVFGDAA